MADPVNRRKISRRVGGSQHSLYEWAKVIEREKPSQVLSYAEHRQERVST